MLSLKESSAVGSSNVSVAVYKGLTVCVYNVDKPSLELTRRDLVDLINVCYTTSLTDLLAFTYAQWHHQLWGSGARVPSTSNKIF